MYKSIFQLISNAQCASNILSCTLKIIPRFKIACMHYLIFLGLVLSMYLYVGRLRYSYYQIKKLLFNLTTCFKDNLRYFIMIDKCAKHIMIKFNSVKNNSEHSYIRVQKLFIVFAHHFTTCYHNQLNYQKENDLYLLLKMIIQCKQTIKTSLRQYTQLHLSVIEEYSTNKAVSVILLIIQLTQQWIFVLANDQPFYNFMRLPITWDINHMSTTIYNLQLQYVLFSIFIFEKFLIFNSGTQPQILKYSPITPLYLEIIWIPSITLIFIQTYYNIMNGNYFHLIICIFFDVMLIGNVLIHMYLFGDCLTLNTRSIRKLSHTEVDFLILALNILQALLFSNILQMEHSYQLQCSILVIIQIVRLYKQQSLSNYIRIELIYTNIIVSNFNLLLGIVLFNQGRYSFTQLLLLLPITIQIQVHLLDSYIKNIYYKQEIKATDLFNKFVLMINNNLHLNNVQKAIIFQQHRQKCETADCFCHSANNYDALSSQQAAGSQQSKYLQFAQKVKIKINFSQYQLSTQEIDRLREQMELGQIQQFQFVGILINFGYQIEALNLLNKFENSQVVQNIKINSYQQCLYLKYYLRKDLVKTILFNSGPTLEVDIKSYCANQNKKIIIYNTIQQHLLKRITLYEQLNTQRNIYNYNIESFLCILSTDIEQLHQMLSKNYQDVQNSQNLVILQFFESEIMSNLAMVVKNLNQPIIKIDSLQNHVYMIFEMLENQDLHLISKSKNYNRLIAKADLFADLIPSFIAAEHQSLLFNFMKTGKSKFFQKFNQNYIKVSQHEMKPIDFYVEILEQPILNHSEGIQFVVFMNETDKEILSFATNIDHQVCSYSSDLLINFKQDKFNFNKLSVDIIIPSFNSIQTIFKTQETINLYDEILVFNSKKGQYSYKADLTLEARKINEKCYYMVEIAKIQLLKYLEQPDQSTDETKTQLFIPQIKYKNHSKKLVFSQTTINRDLVTQRENSQEQQYAQEFENAPNFTSNLSSPNYESRDPILEIIPHVSEQEYSRQSSIDTRDNQNFGDMKPYTKSLQNQRLINSKQPLFIMKSNIVTVFQFILCILYAIIVIIDVGPDLGVFVSEIDMIGLHASFMGPYDLFFSQRVSITNYQNYQKAGILTMAQFQIIYQPLLANVLNDFNECFVSEYAVLESKSLRTFFINESLTAYFMKENSTQIYPITMGFQEVLIVLISNLVNYRLVYLAGGSTIGTHYYTFQYANYINIHEKFENLTLEIQSYSINRAYNVQTKQIFIWITFLNLCLLCIIYLAYKHAEFDKMNKKCISVFNHVQINDIEIELKRLRNLNQLISKADIITYRFDAKSINKQKSSNKKTTIYNKYKKQSLQILNSQKYTIRNIIAQVTIYSFIVIFSVIINSMAQSYILSYIDTVPFYKLVQDLKFRSGMGYLYREIYLRWSNFPYLTQQDRIRLDNLYYTSIQVQEQYLAISGINSLILGGFNSSQILFSDEFIDFWEQTRSQPLCQFVLSQYMGFLYRYCNMSLDGTLNGGLVSAITFGINDLQTQRVINNFTTRVDYELYEQEGVQIITRVFFEMSDILKAGMQSITSHYINVIKIITIIFIVICLLAIYYTLTIRYYQLQTKHDILKKSVFLLPQNTIYHSDSLERDVIRLYYQLSKL